MKRFLAILALVTLPLFGAHAEMKGMTIGSGSVGADYFSFGSAMQQVLAKAYPKYSFENTSTSGSVENLRLLNRGEIDLGLFQVSEATRGAWDATDRFKNEKPYKNIRVIGALFNFNYALIVPKGSSIRSIEDMAGKRVAIGPDPATQDAHNGPIFAASGVDYMKLRRVYGSYSDIYRQFEEGRVDAGIGYMAGYIPIAAILELASSTELTWLSLDADKLMKAGIVPITVPPGKLPYQTGPVVAAQRGINVLAGSSELTDDQAYKVAEQLHKQLPAIAELVPVLQSVMPSPSSLAGPTDPFPYHPGALKYWKDVGFIK
jgi:TRAP transporter TAXI family solute receptor